MLDKYFVKVITSLFLAAFISIVFMFLYYIVNVWYISYYGHNSCKFSTSLGIFITAPLNYCEDLNPLYSNLSSGLVNNMEVPAIILFFATLYYQLFAQNSKKFMHLLYVIIIAIFSTYLLSSLSLFFYNTPLGGTSIIAFDILLFLLLSLIIDYVSVSKLIKNENHKIYKYIERSINNIREILQNKTKFELVTHKEIKIILFILYTFLILLIIILILFGYIINNKSALLHLYGGGLLLLSLVIINSKKLFQLSSYF